MSDFSARRQRLLRLMKRAGIDGLLVSHEPNVAYLTGFTGEDSVLLVRGGKPVLVSDSRFETQIADECPGLEMAIRGATQSQVSLVAETAKRMKIARLGFESHSLSVSRFEQLKSLVSAELAPTTDLVEELRTIKDKDELTTIARAIASAEKAFLVVRAGLRSSQTEKQIADALEHQMRVFGAQRASFPTIVAAGPRAALPHARPTEQTIGDASMVLVDWGAVRGHYASDLTRVWLSTKIPPKLERVYGVVLTAQTRAIAAIRPGATAQQVDQIARDTIAAAGFGQYFGHALGHGIGREVHEAPRLARNQSRPLQLGMVVTVEPGIYLPGWGGIRIEDDVLVTRTGHEVLTTLPKALGDAVVSRGE